MITIQIKERKGSEFAGRWTFRLHLAGIEVYRAGSFYGTKDDCLRAAHVWIDSAKAAVSNSTSGWITAKKVEL